jgi:hypothetical protein
MYQDPLLVSAGQPSAQTRGAWEELGFHFGDKGTHTSRTMMLDELSTLLRVCNPAASRADYIQSLVDDNCLGKHTLATRKLTLQRLTEL